MSVPGAGLGGALLRYVDDELRELIDVAGALRFWHNLRCGM
jgi:hypothetical protein